MRKIEAYVQPFMLTKVLRELRAAHVHGLTVTDVKGSDGRRMKAIRTTKVISRWTSLPGPAGTALPAEDVEALVDAVRRGAHTGRRGDGKIVVSVIEQVTSIRTGETGHDAV